MAPRARDFLGPGLLVLFLTSLIVLLVVGNIPGR
jgi:hypothetical protein